MTERHTQLEANDTLRDKPTSDIELLWYITPPDGVYPWVPDGRWDVDTDLQHFQRVAATIDQLGFTGALVATSGPNDAFVWASALMPVTTRMKFLLALYPGLISPRQMAHMALTFDALSGGRLLINVINGTDDLFPPHGSYLTSAERYSLSSEYWTIFRRLYAGDRRPYDGAHYQISGTEGFDNAHWEWISPTQVPAVPLWGAGGSPAGLKNAGELLDVYLTFADEPGYLRAKIEAARAAAATAGRSFQDFGLWVSIIVRETEDEAWAVAQGLLDKIGADRLAASVDAQLRTQHGTSGGLAEASSPEPRIQRAIASLRSGTVPQARDLEFSPNLWSGPSDWAPPALLEIFDPKVAQGKFVVGSADQVADLFRSFHDIGIGKFILGGWPLIREAEYVAELLLPRLGRTAAT